MSVFPNRAARRAALLETTLYPVISPEFCAGRDPFAVFAAAVRGGAKIIQLRLKNASAKELFDLACAVRPVADAARVLVMIDDRLDVALAADADGVHLGQDDLPLTAARAAAPELLLGNSTHNAEEIVRAQRDGADYLNIGPVYPTCTKTVQCGALGVATVRELAKEVRIPFSVMGGIKERHFPELVAAGAHRLAMVTEITAAPDVESRVRTLVTQLQQLIGRN